MRIKFTIWMLFAVILLFVVIGRLSEVVPETTTHVVIVKETSTYIPTPEATSTPIMTFVPTQIPASTPVKVWTLDEIRQKINKVAGAEIPIGDYIMTNDILGDYYRHFGYQNNVQAFYDYSTRKMYIDTRMSTNRFSSLVAHESCHYLLDYFGCRQMVGNYGGNTFGESYMSEEAFCDVFAYRLFPEFYSLHDVEYRIRQNNVNCIDTYIGNFVKNCHESNRFICDISIGVNAYEN